MKLRRCEHSVARPRQCFDCLRAERDELLARLKHALRRCGPCVNGYTIECPDCRDDSALIARIEGGK